MALEATLEELRSRPGVGETISIVDPVTEQEITRLDGGAAAIEDAVKAPVSHLIGGVV